MLDQEFLLQRRLVDCEMADGAVTPSLQNDRSVNQRE
jgi:hypothetical protein